MKEIEIKNELKDWITSQIGATNLKSRFEDCWELSLSDRSKSEKVLFQIKTNESYKYSRYCGTWMNDSQKIQVYASEYFWLPKIIINFGDK